MEVRKVFRDIIENINNNTDRISSIEAASFSRIYTVQAASLFLDNVVLTDGVEYTTPNIATTLNISDSLRGIFSIIWITPLSADVNIYLGTTDDTLNNKSPQYRWVNATDDSRQHISQFLMIPVGADGKIKLLASGSNVNVFLAITGYWL